MSVIDALTRLKTEAPGAKENKFAKVHKAGNTDIIVTVIPPSTAAPPNSWQKLAVF